MQDKEMERGNAALRRAEGDTVLCEKNRRNDEILFGNSITNQNSREIISSILSLGKTMQYRVVAEFVETKEQMKTLKGLGCEMYQGYLFSKALPIDELIHYIKGR